MSVFFGGEFFDGGYFKDLEVIEAVTGGKGDNPKRKSIYKPTGLTYRKTVEHRVEESKEIAAEIVSEALVAKPNVPVAMMSLTDIETEIGARLRQKLRAEEEEILCLLCAIT